MKVSCKKFLFCILAAVLLSSAFAESKVFKLNGVTDGILLGTGALLSGGDLIMDNALELNRAEYRPEEIYNKDNINGLDRFFMQDYNHRLDQCADLSVAAAMLTPAVLVFTDKEEWLTIGVMYAETLLIANGVKELSKLVVNRARPYIYFDSEKPEDDLKDGDWANSFPSGHSTMAFAGASFATYTFAKYFPESKWKYAVAGGSFTFAAATAVLRVASGNHFASDVLTGAVLGSGIGLLVPWIHTFNSKHDFNVNPAPDGVSFSYRF